MTGRSDAAPLQGKTKKKSPAKFAGLFLLGYAARVGRGLLLTWLREHGARKTKSKGCGG
jgi:hypothetical protein